MNGFGKPVEEPRKFGHHSVADLNAHVTALDNEKLVGLLSSAENDTAGSYSPCFDTIASQEAKARIGRHCQLPNTPAMLASLQRLLSG
jgi:hypothetical protein